MKKALPYGIMAIGVIALGIMLFIAARHRPRRMNERITLRQGDKIPYGTFAARQLLPQLFPNAVIRSEKSSPGNPETLSESGRNQAVILTATTFNADEYELKELLNFARRGNYVFIIARRLSGETNRFFHCEDNNASMDGFYGATEDSLEINLDTPPFSMAKLFVYPGKKYESYFSAFDTSRTVVLGRTHNAGVNFIQMNAGTGSIFIHLAPLAFSNYFILHKNNVQYFQNALSVIPAGVRKVVWNEYYLSKPAQQNQKEPNLFRVLLEYPAFKWGLLTAIVTLLLYALLEMRRRQRIIPVYEKPQNESLDFVKTIGQLYYERRDHHNLAKKMSTYFLEHVRSRYHIAAAPGDDFAAAVHAKSGYPEDTLKSITYFIQYIKDVTYITDKELYQFYKQLEHFYQNT